MKDRDEQSDSIVIADFLTRYVEDEARGEVQTLARYQALYPGFEEAVAREFLDLEDRRRTRGAGAEDERRVGHYRLLHPLGRGGQGEVHLAEDVRLKRKVALKVIRGWDRDRIHRLRREAEAASRLQHPGICVVHDVGEEEGLHYIAMQYVEGQSLEEAIAEAREEGGEIADPVRLLEKVARALHVAHEVGLVHRDVKPGNILVTPEGKPVLLDFGIVLDTEGEGPTLTGTGQMAGTPAYLAPEQLAEPPVLLDRRADVYGLGITLYECLTLRRPFEAPTRDRLYNKILTAPVLDPRPYNPRITRDLKAVLETAMDKDPDRRYQTALDMAEDLRRIQMFEPVRARPAGPGLRLRRWARRNRALAGALLGIFLALVAGLGVSLHFLVESNRDRRLAETNFQRAVKAVDRMLTEVGLSEAQLADLPELDDTRRRLLERALAFYQELLTDPRSGTRVRQGTANAHLRVASIHYRLGNLEAAEQEIHHALAMFRELVAEHPENLGFRSGLVDALGMQPMILASIGRGRESIDLYRKAIASARELLERAPGVKEYMCLLARCLAKCGQQLYTLGDRNAATPAYREAIRLLQGVADLPSCNSVDRFELAVFSVRFATISIGSPHRDEARKRLEEARVVLQNLFEASPHDSSITRYLAEAHLVLGRFEMARSLEKADAYFLAAIKGLEKLVSRHPRQWGGRLVLARSLLYRADNLLIRGKFTEAEEALKKAGTLSRDLSAMLPDNPNLRGDLTRIYYTLADCLNRCNRREEAREMDERALVLARGVAGDLDDSRGQRLLAGVLEASGYRMARWDDPAGGEERLRKALEIQERLFSQEEPRISKGSLARTLDHLATACDMQGRSGEAEKMYRRAIAIRRELAESRPDNAGIHCDLGAVLHNLAFCLSRRGELEAACDLLEEAIEVQLAALDSEPDLKSASRYLAKHCRFLGGYRLRLGDVEEAASVVETVVQLEIRDARLHYALAVVLVGCASASGDAKRKEDFLDRAVRCFMKAVDLGFRDTNLIKKDRRIWVHLRGREEFQRLMKPLR